MVVNSGDWIAQLSATAHTGTSIVHSYHLPCLPCSLLISPGNSLTLHVWQLTLSDNLFISSYNFSFIIHLVWKPLHLIWQLIYLVWQLVLQLILLSGNISTLSGNFSPCLATYSLVWQRIHLVWQLIHLSGTYSPCPVTYSLVWHLFTLSGNLFTLSGNFSPAWHTLATVVFISCFLCVTGRRHVSNNLWGRA